jgi:hypothetical protein
MSNTIWIIFGLVAFVGFFGLVYWMIKKSQAGDRRYDNNSRDYPIASP